MAIKNGRYKDKNGAVRHFETNENMVIVDDGQKTLKQKLSSLVESLSDLLKKFTTHETSATAHEDIRAELDKTGISDVSVSPATTGFNDLLSFAKDLQLKNRKMWHGTVSGFSDLPVQDWGFQCDLQMTGGNILATINKQQSGGQIYIRETNASDVWISEWREVVDKATLEEITINRGYLTSLQVDDLNTITKNGKYTASPATANAPLTESWFNVDVTVDASGNGYQRAYCYAGGAMGKTYTRYLTNGEISTWQEITTKDVTDAMSNRVSVVEYDRGYLKSKRATDTSMRQNGIYTTWGDASGAPSGQGFGNYISTVGEDVRNIAELYLSAHSNGGVWYRGGAYADNPEWQRVLTSDIGFYNRNLNEFNIDSARGNWCAGFSVSDGMGTLPFGGWNNIMQFECNHFITQLSAHVNSSSASAKGLAVRSKWVSSETFSPWYEVALIETGEITLLNGWGVHQVLKCVKVGNVVTISGMIGNGVQANGTVIGVVPVGFRPSTGEPHFMVSTDNGSTVTAHGQLAIDASTGNISIRKMSASTYIAFCLSYVI